MRLITIGIACWTMLAAAQFESASAAAQLAGHGGPVRALAVSVRGDTALSGSFDTSAIRWSLRRGVAEQVLRFHEGAVNAVAILPDGRDVTAGEDGDIALWTPRKQEPDAVLKGHKGPIVALSVSPDGRWLASASWDDTIRVWPLGGGAPIVLESQQKNVNGVAFAPNGQRLVSAGYDGSLRIWPLRDQSSPAVATLPTPLNAVVVAPDGEIITAGADGKLYFLSAAGELRASVDTAPAPITSIALSIDGERVAASSMAGTISVIDRKTRALMHRMEASRLPVWAVAFLPDGHSLLSGGGDRLVRRWNTDTGAPIGTTAGAGPEDPLAAYAEDPGAQVFRACVACHTLKPDEGNRAGPTLHGIFGRRIATLPSYKFSPALTRLDIIWTPETLAKLFEVGPAHYTPGTKMPEQRIGRAEDREALVKFLERTTQ
jgi:cytochrome c